MGLRPGTKGPLTCGLRAFRKRLPNSFRLTYCHNVNLGRRDFYRQLCGALGVAPSATTAAVFRAVSSHVSELGNDRVHPVFLFDEAHLLNQDTLGSRLTPTATQPPRWPSRSRRTTRKTDDGHH
jgi:hypothetical protein